MPKYKVLEQYKFEILIAGFKAGASFTSLHGAYKGNCVVSRVTESYLFYTMPSIGEFQYRENHANALRYIRKNIWVLVK